AWAERQAAGEIDPSMKGVAANYALPAVPHADWPREAITHAAPLLDPRELGIDVGEVLRLPVRHAAVSPMLGDPEKEYLVHESAETVYVYDDPADDVEWESAHDVEPPTAWLRPSPAAGAAISNESRQDLRGIESLRAGEAARAPAPKPAKRKPRPRRDTVCVDFDGVLHSYVSGWKGGTVIPDPPVPGAIEWLTKLHESYEIAILSTRT